IDRVVENKKLDGRNVVVKRLRWNRDLKDLTQCNILFVSLSEREHISDLVNMVKWLPILTIGETPGFAARGGIINLTLEDNKVRFEVNIGAAKQANLYISSRLLVLAKIVLQGATATLSALKAKDDIVAAALYSPEGKLFAHYFQADKSLPSSLPSRSQQNFYRFEDGYLHVFQQVTMNGERVGTLYLLSDMRQW